MPEGIGYGGKSEKEVIKIKPIEKKKKKKVDKGKINEAMGILIEGGLLGPPKKK